MPKFTDPQARAIILRTLTDWSPSDLARLAALISLGLPSDVVIAGPPITIAPGDNWGGRRPMPEEGMRASVLHAWREVSRWCGEPMAAPHEVGGKR